MFLGCWRIFWGHSSIFDVTIKGQELLKQYQTERNGHEVTMRLWHEYIRRGDPTFVPFLAVALMDLEHLGLWLFRGWVGWVGCLVAWGCIQNYPNWSWRFQVLHIPHLKGWFWIWWWEDVDFGDDEENSLCWPKQWFQRWPNTIGIYDNPWKHRGE